jgi:hypoxanthine phosphoribosyltransferase
MDGFDPKHTITPLITTEQLSTRLSVMANEIAKQLPKDIMVVSLLKGSFVFTADLIRALYATGMKPQVDFMTLASYGSGTQSGGIITVIKDINDIIEGRHVLIVDDILESGRTLKHARDLIAQRNPASIHICVLLEKPGKCKVDIAANHVGFAIDDKFVVGMGLDYANYYRELPYIGVVEFTGA